jgi:hypothetical protein
VPAAGIKNSLGWCVRGVCCLSIIALLPSRGYNVPRANPTRQIARLQTGNDFQAMGSSLEADLRFGLGSTLDVSTMSSDPRRGSLRISPWNTPIITRVRLVGPLGI